MFSESHFYFTVKEIATQSANACFPTLQDKAKHAVRREIFLLQVRNRNQTGKFEMGIGIQPK